MEVEEKQALSSYFDTLPENATGTVFRALSDSPRADNWSIHMNCNILGLCGVGGELGRFLSTRFSGIYLYNTRIGGSRNRDNTAEFVLEYRATVICCEVVGKTNTVALGNRYLL